MSETMTATTGVVCTPLWWEQRALRGRVKARMVRTGRGRQPAGTAAAAATPEGVPLLIAGVAGALAHDMRPGDVVVSDELRTDDAGLGSGGGLPSHAAPMLAGALRRLGLRVHVGPVRSCEKVVTDIASARVSWPGELAVDTESAYLAASAPAGQAVALRAIVDTPDAPLARPGTAGRGLAALRSLRAAAPAIDAWAAATGSREVLLAAPRSFCAGVDRAIEIVERALALHGPPVYVRRQIVHNVHVVRELERRGAVFVAEVADVPEGAVVVLAAHGVAPTVREEADKRHLQVIDATCPLVTKVHTEVRRFAAHDDTIFLIGHPDHEEVVGTSGEAPSNVVVVADPQAAEKVQAVDPDRVAYVMQTTLAVDEAERTAGVLRQRFPKLTAPRKDDICYATTNRQWAVRAVARECDLVLVLGSQNSSNSHRLAEVATDAGAQAQLVDDAGAVDLSWLAGVRRLGVTAGASAPPQLVDDLVRCLSGLGPVSVSETSVVGENVRFTLPREVS